MQVSQITPCKGEWKFIEQNLDKWLDSDVDEVIIVDYDCPDGTAKRLLAHPRGRDPKLRVVIAGPKIAGPFYNVGRAFNIGASASRFESLLFLRARDTLKNDDAILNVKEQWVNDEGQSARGPAIVTLYSIPRLEKGLAGFSEDTLENLESMSAFICLNGVFHAANGFSEELEGVGTPTIEFLVRAAPLTSGAGGIMDIATEMEIDSLDTTDWESDAYMPKRFSTSEDVTVAKKEAFDAFLAFHSKAPAQPAGMQGISCGVRDPHPQLQFYVSGQPRAFNPGEV